MAGHKVVTAGYGDYGKLSYVTTAFAEDKTFSVSYLFMPQTLTVDLGQFAGKSVKARWFNPRSGQMVGGEKVFTQKAKQTFTPPEKSGDWVLWLSSK